MRLLPDDFVDPSIEEALRKAGISGFEDLWNLPHEWVQPPNQRHGGWNGVARHEVGAPGREEVTLFLKVHENRTSRSLMHPLGIPTLRREFRTMQAIEAIGIPVPRPVLFMERNGTRPVRAIMATLELTGFRSLADLSKEWWRTRWPPLARRRPLIEGVARILRTGHDHGWRFHAFTMEHLWVREGDQAPEFRVIDLERSKRVVLRSHARLRDLTSLQRTAPRWSRTDCLRFLLAYAGERRFTRRLRWLWKAVEAARRRERKERGR